MELASQCIQGQIFILGKLHNDLIQWQNKCFELPEKNAIDYETYGGLMNKTFH